MAEPKQSGIANILAVLGLGLLLAACKGVPTQSEKAARHQAETAAADYRPRGEQPPLPVLDTNSSLGDFLKFALLNQSKVEAAYFDWLASIERITVARSFPDPQLTFQMDIEDVVTSVMPGLMMTFPGLGKRHAGAEVASAESQSKYFAFQSSVLESAFEVKNAYYPLYFLDEKIRVNQENLRLLGDLESIAKAQNAVGKVTLQDILRAQIAGDRLRTDIANLEDSRTSLLARFKASLGLKAEDPAPPVPQKFESTTLDLTADRLFETALSNNTRLKSMEADLRAADAAVVLARKARNPDASLGLMADAKTSPTLYRPLATLSLPIWRDKLAAQLAEAQANKHAAEARLNAEQIALAVDFTEKSYLFRETSRNLALLRDQLLPKARQSFEVARIGYLSGQLDFFNLSDTESTLLGVQLDEVEAATQRELVLTSISLLIQGLSPANTVMKLPGGSSTGTAFGPKKTGGGM